MESDDSSWTWRHYCLAAFCLWQSLAMLFAALPGGLLTPTVEEELGSARAGQVEKRLYDFRKTLESSGFPLSSYNYLAGVQQQWNTFAPVPPKRYANYTVVVEGPSGSVTTWSDQLDLDRPGAGFLYDPTVKLVSLFGLPMVRFQEAFLKYQAKVYFQTFQSQPTSVALHSKWIQLDVGEDLKPTIQGPFQTEVLRRRLRDVR